MSYPPPPPPGYGPPTPPPYQYPPRGPVPYQPITREKVTQDVKNILQQLGFEVIEAKRCTAMVEFQKGYVSYYQPHELGNVQAVLQVFTEQECKPNNVKTLYLWHGQETGRNTIHIGFFKSHQTSESSPLVTLVMITIYTV